MLLNKPVILAALLCLCSALAWAEEPKPGQPEVSEDFSFAVDAMMPLTPAEIKQLRGLVEGKQAAINAVTAPLTTTLKSVPVSLQPGAVTPSISLFPNHAVALEILDVTGAPWPITSHIVGDSERFAVLVPEVGDTNVVTISPQTVFGRTNVLFTLASNSTPVAVTLQADADIEHYHDRITLIVNGRGPKALPPSIVTLPGAESMELLAVLDGIRPGNATRLTPSEARVTQAWRDNNTLWLRGDFLLISPAPHSQITGAANMSAYQLAYTPVVLIYTPDGETRQVQLEEQP